MSMGLLEPAEIPDESILAFPSFNLRLHAREIRRELEIFAIGKPDVVVCRALKQLNTFSL
ncbi:hypothetical protein RRF57_009651 [Xylaria bambusicola]|uniref:Uncharacterized protein n=1 Tax=Xylaria bambusicola TaxID=326684 RepID=A0AAN7Z940_9PEZI